MSDYLAELNPEQQKAVECTEGPVMIIAGAGSGKTRVLTYRIAHLMKKGVDPFNILSLTFTNKAAREMKERIAQVVGIHEAKNLWMGTFHSVFARILRVEAEKIGYPSNFTIYDTDDSKSLIKTILKELQLDDKIYKTNIVYNRISAAKNSLISSQQYLNNKRTLEEDQQSAKPKLGEVYDAYTRRCFKAGAMDFDDLLYKTNILLRDYPDVLYKYQHLFKYILVDEYQDTNFSQYMIVKQLAALNENICVVGDDAQSIYAFRGANIQNILNFEKDYPDMKTFKLEQNYRSTQNIVNAANTVISNNKKQLKKEVWTHNEEGSKIKVMRALTDNEEGTLVANEVFQLKMNEQAKDKEFGILYRTNSQSRAMEEALRKLGIPYRIYGGLSFYKRKEIKDLLAYYRMAINPHDEEALKRIINYPARGIGNTTLEKLMIVASDHDISIWKALENLQDFDTGLNSGAIAKLKDFETMIRSFIGMLQTHNAYELGHHIASSSGILKELYNDKSPEGLSRYENIQELLNGLKEFSATPDGEEEKVMILPEFMQDIALLTDADNDKEQDKNSVSLMTIHAAKGLEFPYVFVVGMEENLFPSQLSLNSRADLEEERRLFYVALTRGMKRATLSYATTRYRWGSLISCEPSRFIEEVDAQYLDHPAAAQRKDFFADESPQRERAIHRAKKKINPPPSPNPAMRRNLVKMNTATKGNYDNSHLKDLQVGMEVEHERFGTGKVVQLEGAFPNNKATVEFSTAGKKQLLLKFARLNILT